MALQVWLPLTTDLHNQGLLNDVTISNRYCTYESGGKIGGCYHAGINQDLILNKRTSDLFSDNHSFTIAIWIKFISAPVANSGIFASMKYLSEPTAGGFGLVNKFDKIQLMISGTDFSEADPVGSFITPEIGKWIHIAATYDNSTSTYSLYLNGSLIKSNVYTTHTYVANNQNFVLGGCSQDGWNSKNDVCLNDIRLYDHCLSPKEVKEISKGLVLHYPLNDAYVQSTTNLNKSIGTSWSNWGENTITSNSFISPEGTIGSHVNCSSYTGGDIYVSHSSFSVKPSTTYIISAKMKLTGYTHSNLFYWREYDSSNTKLSESGKWSSTRFIEYGHGYKLYYGTVTTASTTSLVSLQSYLYGVGEYWIYDIQVEEGDYPTPFAGYNTSRIATTVYDCSGYQNNGTIKGSLSCSTDSPRYKISTVFDGTSAKIINESFPTSIVNGTNPFTICGWAYCIKGNSYYPLFHIGFNYRTATGICLHENGNRIEVLDINGTKINNIYGSGYSNEKWVHQCIVYDGTTIKRYLNGNSTPIQSIACPGFKSDNNKLSVGGFWESTFKGYLSDFRIYATALSEEDIKELYDTSAYVLDNGTLLTYNLEE